MKRNLFFTSMLILVLISFNTMGQFTKKMEMDFHFGFKHAASKQLTVAEDYIFEIGKTRMPMYGIDVWYNITRDISVGLNSATTIYLPTLNEDEVDEESLPIDQSFNSYVGLGVKYHVVNKKKFKVYGKTNMHYSFHRVMVKDYYFVKTGYFPFEDEIKFSDDNDHEPVYTGFGAAINVGMKTYFGNAGGMVFEGGYLNNGYYKGITFTLGFFFDFINN